MQVRPRRQQNRCQVRNLIAENMNWSNVKLIFLREVRDQLRDRRTLFMIAVLPLLLYPLLGMSFFQVSQFLREQPTNVLLVGLPELRGLPPLVEDEQFSQGLARRHHQPIGQFRFRTIVLPDLQNAAEIEKTLGVPAEDAARQLVQQGGFDAVVYFPERFRCAAGAISHRAGPATFTFGWRAGTIRRFRIR